MVTRKLKRQLAVIVIVFVCSSMVVDIFTSLTGNRNSSNSHSEYTQYQVKYNNVSISNADNELEPVELLVTNNLKKTNEESVRWRLEARELFAEDSAAVHGHFWKAIGASKDASVTLNPLSESERTKLQGVLQRRSLWGTSRSESFERSGFSSEYEWRILSQLLWQHLGHEIHPDLLQVFQNDTKKIALRDGFKWWNYKGERYLQCPGSFSGRCEMLDWQDTDEADAVINVVDSFHKHSYNAPRNTSNIFFILESPYASPQKNLYRRNDFLASYWRGSEIPAPYATWAYYNPSVREKAQTRNFAEGRTKKAAIFVSNCYALNDRLKFVEELKTHMDVDVFGECGRDGLKCNRGDKTCFENLQKNYRFYLAFENSNCRDYITEKFFSNALEHDLIPVVMGGHRSDYEAVAPQNSFIHTEDFPSPKELADYLTTLSTNDSLYNEYFRWKGTGEFIDANFLCRVCSMLWYAEVDPPPVRKGVMRWRPVRDDSDRMCLPSQQWYWKRKNSLE